jgi:hypothetical protein
MSRHTIEDEVKEKKFSYRINKPKKEKHGRTGVEFIVEPQHPITIHYDGKVVAHIVRTVTSPKGVAEGIVKALNEQDKYILPI